MKYVSTRRTDRERESERVREKRKGERHLLLENTNLKKRERFSPRIPSVALARFGLPLPATRPPTPAPPRPPPPPTSSSASFSAAAEASARTAHHHHYRWHYRYGPSRPCLPRCGYACCTRWGWRTGPGDPGKVKMEWAEGGGGAEGIAVGDSWFCGGRRGGGGRGGGERKFIESFVA